MVDNMKDTIDVKSADYGHVRFSNMSLRQQEVLNNIDKDNMFIIGVAIAAHKYSNDQELGSHVRKLLDKYKSK
jgi:hypothetical protein